MMWPLIASLAFGLVVVVVIMTTAWLVWSRKRTVPPARQSAVVTFDGDAVTCRRPSGLIETVKWSDLRAVLIQTTPDGPEFCVLLGEKTGCVVPSESAGMDDLLARLQALPGFDNKAVIAAMACTDEQKFLCWERKSESMA